MIKNFTEFLNENELPRKYGCLMLNFMDNGWKEEIESIVSPDDLYTEEEGHGFENEPHCTVLYGFHDDAFSLDKCIEMLVPVSSLKIVADKIGIFSNEKYDVLKYDIKSDELNTLNSTFAKTFEHTNDFPEYHAHCTIAYLKPGTGEKYVKEIEKTFVPKEYKYSYGKGDKVYIQKKEEK